MAVPRLMQGLISHESPHGAIDLWPSGEVLRIEALRNEEVYAELRDIMEGRNYSWNRISQFLQEQLEIGALEFTLRDGDVVFEWNNLCDEKQKWERQQCLSVDSPDYNRDCLINLKLIPIQGGIGSQGSQLVTANLDESGIRTRNLWVYSDKWEIVPDLQRVEFLSDDDDDSSWDSEASQESRSEDENEYDGEASDGSSYDFIASDDEESVSE